jgi:hypothetical protein
MKFLISFELKKYIPYGRYGMKIWGIDLAGKEENPSGICILEDN